MIDVTSYAHCTLLLAYLMRCFVTGNDIGYLIDADETAVFEKAACRLPFYYS